MPFCPSCGREVGAGEQFCANCGSKLNPAPRTPDSMVATKTTALPLDLNQLMLIILGIIGVHALYTLVVWFNSGSIISLWVFALDVSFIGGIYYGYLGLQAKAFPKVRIAFLEVGLWGVVILVIGAVYSDALSFLLSIVSLVAFYFGWNQMNPKMSLA